MKNIKKIILGLSVLGSLTACKKADFSANSIAGGAINVINAVPGGATITLTTSNNVISTNNTVGNNASAFLPLATGNLSVNLGIPAVPATLTSPAVPAIPYYSQTLNIDKNTNYSLFLTGASPATIESVLIKESYARTYADSVCAVRVINLVSDSNPISVNISGDANGSEVPSLSYKAYSQFKQHPAKAINSSYVFEFRDAASGNLLTSYTLKTPYFHNVTLVFRGLGSSVGVTLNSDY